MSNTTTYEEIIKLCNEIKAKSPPRPRMWWEDPMMLNGIKVFTEPPKPPKFKLAEHIQVSPEFRAKFDQMLLETFGRQESIIPPGKMYMFGDYALMRSDDWSVIMSNTTA